MTKREETYIDNLHKKFATLLDGFMNSSVIEYENKEVWVKNLLEEIETDNVQRIANIILAQAIDNGVGVAKDDMTVIVTKVKRI